MDRDEIPLLICWGLIMAFATFMMMVIFGKAGQEPQCSPQSHSRPTHIMPSAQPYDSLHCNGR